MRNYMVCSGGWVAGPLTISVQNCHCVLHARTRRQEAPPTVQLPAMIIPVRDSILAGNQMMRIAD